MAVTYAWRLDANKYAYILSPEQGLTETDRYGYVSETPLVGDSLNSVAATANEWFGEGGTKGFSGYVAAYNAMIEKIKTKPNWGDAKFYDLLSADVYYNVDSANCADLRGVGIQGIRYLGASADYDPANPSWNPSIQQTDTINLAGNFSIYGIYMDDQDNDDPTNLSPERIFAVYNGRNGADMNGNFGTDVLQEMLEGEITRSTTADSEHGRDIATLKSDVATLKSDVDDLSQLSGGDLSGLLTTISGLTATIGNLQEQINDLRGDLEAIKNPSSGSGGVDNPSSGANITIANYNNNIGSISLVGIDDDDTLYRIERASYNKDDVNLVGKVTASSFYQNE